MEQRSDDWFAARRGKVTASRINDVMSTLKSGGEAASRKNYRAQLVVERLTDQTGESYINGAMQWGIDNEDAARECYQFTRGVYVEEVGFIDHPTIPMCGASPDGLVGDGGLLEIKCPDTATHIDWLLAGVVPAEHITQMQWQMDCANRGWCDFVSYDPRMPVELQLFIVRLMRDNDRIEAISKAVVTFLGEVEATVSLLREKASGGAK